MNIHTSIHLANKEKHTKNWYNTATNVTMYRLDLEESTAIIKSYK